MEESNPKYVCECEDGSPEAQNGIWSEAIRLMFTQSHVIKVMLQMLGSIPSASVSRKCLVSHLRWKFHERQTKSLANVLCSLHV